MDKSIKEKLSNIIKIPEYIKDSKEILDLNLKYFNGIDTKIAKNLNSVLGIKKIGDLITEKIDDSKILTLKVLGVDPYELNIWIFVAKVISENKIEELLGPKKIILVGLDNAGKTAILHILQNKLNLDIFEKMAPTIGINRGIIEKSKSGIIYRVLDMGGQEEYRKNYIQNAEKYFVGVDYVMYVIDIQDPLDFEQSLEYLREIIRTLELLKENPKFLIIINKFDSDVKDDLEIIESYKFLEQQVKSIFEFKDFTYDITPYSIYNVIGDKKAIIKGIRDCIMGLSETKIPEGELGGSLEKILTLIVNLASSIESRFIELEEQNRHIVEWINHLRSSLPETQKEIVDEVLISQKSKLEETKEILKESLSKDLKSILKIREEDIEKL